MVMARIFIGFVPKMSALFVIVAIRILEFPFLSVMQIQVGSTLRHPLGRNALGQMIGVLVLIGI